MTDLHPTAMTGKSQPDDHPHGGYAGQGASAANSQVFQGQPAAPIDRVVNPIDRVVNLIDRVVNPIDPAGDVLPATPPPRTFAFAI